MKDRLVKKKRKEKPMTFKQYKHIYGKESYCSLNELENIREESNPRSYKAILAHWKDAHYRELEELKK